MQRAGGGGGGGKKACRTCGERGHDAAHCPKGGGGGEDGKKGGKGGKGGGASRMTGLEAVQALASEEAFNAIERLKGFCAKAARAKACDGSCGKSHNWPEGVLSILDAPEGHPIRETEAYERISAAALRGKRGKGGGS